MKKIVVVLLALFALTTFSCEVGLGSAVDIYVPTVGINYPPKNAVVRDTFVAAGECNDDMGLSKVEVSLFNPETGKTYGPYDATISDDAKTWSVQLNKRDASKTTNIFNSYKQWEIPDGNYIISAIAYDNANKNSQTATSPIAIDNTAPVLIISKPLATGNETATVYGRSLKLTGDIAEEHETSKLILNYKQYDDSQGDFIDTEVKTLVLNDSAELTAMSSSNPLVIAKYDENKPDSEQHKNYLKLYGNTADDVDRYYYSGILIEDNARIYNAPGDNGSGTGNQTQQYYLLSQAFSKDLAVNYSLTAPRLMEILRGENGSYTTEHLSHIEEVLTTQGNFASSVALSKLDDEALAKAQSSKFSLNPHNNPTWTLDEYGISEPAAGATTFQEVKAYTAGSSLILSLRAGRDASYPDPKTVKLSLYNLGNYNSTVDYYNYDITNITPVVLIDPDGSTNWNESADDSEKTKTFTLSTDGDGLIANYVYRVVVEGTDRNRVDLEPEGDNVYVFKVTSSNNIPTVTITENLDGKVFGTAVNTTGVTVKGYVKTDGIALDQTNPITVSDFTIKNMDGTSAGTKDDYDLSPVGNPVDDPDGTPNKYWFEIRVKAISGKVFVPSTQSKYLYTITVKAKDAGQNEGTKNAKFYVDNLPPTVTEPTVSPVVNIVENSVSKEYVNGKLKVSGTASDSGKTGSGLKSISWKITKSGETNAAAQGDIEGAPENWEFEIPTKNFEDNKDYIITVTATDIVDNSSPAEKTIKLNQSTDTPVLTLKNASPSINDQNKLVSASTNMFNTSGNNKLYILVKDDDFKARVIEFIKGLKTIGGRKLTSGKANEDLITRIITLDQVKMDF